MENHLPIHVSHYFLDSKLPPQPQLQPVHLAIVCGMIVAAKMKEAVKNKLRNFLVEGQTVFLRLSRGLLN